MKVTASNQLAFEHFKNYNFKRALYLLVPSLKLIGKPEFPLAIDKTKILLGLVHLYQGEFDKVADYLSFTKDSDDPNIRNFYFYYILAELYQQKLEKKEDFNQFHKIAFSQLPDTHKKYLAAVFYLQKNDFNSFKKIIAAIKGEKVVEQSNLLALNNIFGQKELSLSQDKTAQLKGLYKSYNKLETNEFEYAFLSQYEEIKQFTEDFQNSITQQEITVQIIRLLEEHQPMDDSYFEQLLVPALVPKRFLSILPYIVYNHIALLYNAEQKDAEDIHQLALGFKQHFFKIPESLHLFLSILGKTETPIRFKETTDIFQQYLAFFEAKLPTKNVTMLSWEIVNYFLYCRQEIFGTSYNAKIVNFSNQYPNLIAFKWICLLTSVSSNDVVSLHINQLNIFYNPNTQNSEEIILVHVNHLLREFKPIDMPQMMFSSMQIPKQKKEIQIYKSVLLALWNMIQRAITGATPHPKVKVVLGILKVLGENIEIAINKHQIDFSKDTIPGFIELYEQMLSHFDENHKASEYYQSLQVFKYLPELKKLRDVLDSQNERKIQAAYKKFADKDQFPLLIQSVLEEITINQYYAPEYKAALLLLFKTIYLHQPTNAKETIYRTVEQYQKQSDSLFRDDGLEELYIAVLQTFLKDYNKSEYYALIYWLSDAYTETIIKYPIPIHYNLAGKLLIFMMKVIKKQTDFEYDAKFVSTLMDFVRKVVKQRKLKTLGNTLKRAEAFFIGKQGILERIKKAIGAK